MKIKRIVETIIQYAYILSIILLNPFFNFDIKYTFAGILFAIIGIVMVFDFTPKYGFVGRIINTFMFPAPAVLSFTITSLIKNGSNEKMQICGLFLLIAYLGYFIKQNYISNISFLGNIFSHFPYIIAICGLLIVFSDIDFPIELKDNLFNYGSIGLFIASAMGLYSITDSAIYLYKWRKEHGRD